MGQEIKTKEDIDLIGRHLFKTINHIGFIKTLTLIFVTLKICKVIDWSWVIVLSPIWITAAFWLMFYTIAAVILAYLNRNNGR